VVQVNGNDRETTYSSENRLSVLLLDSDLQTVSPQHASAHMAGNLSIKVVNTTGSGILESSTFEVPIQDQEIDFSDPVILATRQPNAPYLTFQTMHVDRNGVIYVAFDDYFNDVGRLFVTRSLDNGDTWNTPVQVSDTAPPNASFQRIAFDAEDNPLFIYGEDIYPTDSANIYLTRSYDKGLTWTPTKRLFADYPWIIGPNIVIFPNQDIGVIFFSYETEHTGYVHFARSKDGGDTWTITQIDTGDQLMQSELILDQQGTLHLAYRKQDTGDGVTGPSYYYARSTDNGTTWERHFVSSRVQVYRQGGYFSPSLIPMPDGTIYTSWNYNDVTTSPDIKEHHFTRSYDNGATWEESIQLNQLIYPTSGTWENMVMDSQGILYTLVMEDYVFLFRTKDGGTTWDAPIFLQNDFPLGSTYIAIGSNDTLLLTWSDYGYVYFCKGVKR
jgi:hypothetical protein